MPQKVYGTVGNAASVSGDLKPVHPADPGTVKGTESFSWLRVLAVWVFCCVYVFLLMEAIRRGTDGTFVYPLDDSYIHLSLARNLAQSHVWGLRPDGFASASSSPGWTLLLAGADVLFGPRLEAPILLNLLFALLLIAVIEYALALFAGSARSWLRYLTHLALVVFIPLPSLVLLGMEHVAQCFVILLLVVTTTALIQSKRPARPLLWTSCVLGGLLAGAIRYESVFVILIAVALLFIKRQYLFAAAMAVSSALSPLAFALFAHRRSGFYLPFSVIAKASQHRTLLGRFHLLLNAALGLQDHKVPLFGIALVVWCIGLNRRSFWSAAQLLLFFACAITALHLFLAPTGWLMRYESYLECLLLVSLTINLLQLDALPFSAASLRGWSTWQTAAAGLLLVLGLTQVVALIERAVRGTRDVVEASEDRFDEHIQMARFIAAAYDHDTVVVNDIGAIAWYSQAHLLDIVGLGSAEPLQASKHHKSFTEQDLATWAAEEHASIAVVQPDWSLVKDLLPPDWVLVEKWRFPRNVVFSDYTVGLYAVQKAGVPRLCSALEHFQLVPADRIVFNGCSGQPAASEIQPLEQPWDWLRAAQARHGVGIGA